MVVGSSHVIGWGLLDESAAVNFRCGAQDATSPFAVREEGSRGFRVCDLDRVLIGTHRFSHVAHVQLSGEVVRDADGTVGTNCLADWCAAIVPAIRRTDARFASALMTHLNAADVAVPDACAAVVERVEQLFDSGTMTAAAAAGTLEKLHAKVARWVAHAEGRWSRAGRADFDAEFAVGVVWTVLEQATAARPRLSYLHKVAEGWKFAPAGVNMRTVLATIAAESLNDLGTSNYRTC